MPEKEIFYKGKRITDPAELGKIRRAELRRNHRRVKRAIREVKSRAGQKQILLTVPLEGTYEDGKAAKLEPGRILTYLGYEHRTKTIRFAVGRSEPPIRVGVQAINQAGLGGALAMLLEREANTLLQ